MVGYPDYEVSNHGRVRSVARIITRGNGIRQPIAAKILSIPTKGHAAVSIRKGNKIRVHILVLEAFKGSRPPGKCGLHKDDDEQHNHLPNLYWGTRSENTHDSIRNGTHSSLVRTITGTKKRTKKDRDEAVLIREWASEHGIKLSPTGRIPNEVREMYKNGAKTVILRPAPKEMTG